MSLMAIAVHSGYGHTLRLAQALQDGAASVTGTRVELIDVGAIGERDWELLAQADAIVFGSPTYMGGPSGVFKTFADASSKAWFSQL